MSSNLWGIYHVNINCTDLEKSRWFYEQFGFRVMMDMRNRDRQGNPRKATPPQQSLYESLGLPRDSHCDGYMMATPGHPDRCHIDLLEWHIDHPNYKPDPGPRHAASLGYQRIDVYTTNLNEDIARLHEVGIDPCFPICDEPNYMGGYMHQCCFLDPDGTLIELCEVTTDLENEGRKRLFMEPDEFEVLQAERAKRRAEREKQAKLAEENK